MEIIINNTAYLREFIALNEAWITHYFTLESSDFELAKNPEKIIKDGGFVFFLLSEDEVAGVCALFNEGDGCYELARMAVSPKHQGKGFGDALIQAAIQKSHDVKAKRLYLISNTKLEAAIALYKKHGFKTETVGQHPVYSRANIRMGYDLSENKEGIKQV